MRRILASLLTTVFFFTTSAPYAYAQAAQTAAGSRVAAPAPVTLTLPLKEGSTRFMVVGDTGTGGREQYELASVMLRYWQAFPFEFALMMGDNLYGTEKAEDYKKKFEEAYRPLLDNKVKFYATLGNHDESNERFYEHFNMNGEEYYNFKKGNVTFFHHPPYSSGGKHGSSSGLREVVEPLFLKYGVNVVLAGHEHFYERVKPQKGIYYFISGAGGKLREGDVKNNSPLTEKAFDTDLSFMLFEVVKDEMYFQVVSRAGDTVDSGTIPNLRKKGAAASN